MELVCPPYGIGVPTPKSAHEGFPSLWKSEGHSSPGRKRGHLKSPFIPCSEIWLSILITHLQPHTINSFLHSFKKHEFGAYYVQETLLNSGDTLMNKTVSIFT